MDSLFDDDDDGEGKVVVRRVYHDTPSKGTGGESSTRVMAV